MLLAKQLGECFPCAQRAIPQANDNLIQWLTLITLATGLIVLFWKYIGAPVRREWLAARRARLADEEFNRKFRADWNGTDGTAGHQVQPGVMESLHVLRKDSANLEGRLRDIEDRLEEHQQTLRDLRAEIDRLYPKPYGGQARVATEEP